MMNLVASQIRQRCTVVLVEHNMRIVAGWCDRAVVLHFGQKIYDGTPDGLTQDRGVVDAYLGVAELGRSTGSCWTSTTSRSRTARRAP